MNQKKNPQNCSNLQLYTYVSYKNLKRGKKNLGCPFYLDIWLQIKIGSFYSNKIILIISDKLRKINN